MILSFSVNHVSLNAQNDAKPIAKEEKKQEYESHGIQVPIAGINQETMTVQKLLEAGEIEINEKYVIKSFTMSILINGAYADYSSDSGVFTSQMRKMIKTLVPGQKVLFEDVKA